MYLWQYCATLQAKHDGQSNQVICNAPDSIFQGHSRTLLWFAKPAKKSAKPSYENVSTNGMPSYVNSCFDSFSVADSRYSDEVYVYIQTGTVEYANLFFTLYDSTQIHDT